MVHSMEDRLRRGRQSSKQLKNNYQNEQLELQNILKNRSKVFQSAEDLLAGSGRHSPILNGQRLSRSYDVLNVDSFQS